MRQRAAPVGHRRSGAGLNRTIERLERVLAQGRELLDRVYASYYATPADFAREWGVSTSTVRRWIAEGRIPVIKPTPHRFLIPREEAGDRIRRGATISWRRGSGRPAKLRASSAARKPSVPRSLRATA